MLQLFFNDVAITILDVAVPYIDYCDTLLLWLEPVLVV
jgi:hypothetical protein